MMQMRLHAVTLSAREGRCTSPIATSVSRVLGSGCGRGYARERINDLWIAAIAASRALPVVTQDDDFAALDGAANLTIIRV